MNSTRDVLLVEDDATSRAFMREALHARGWRVHEADDLQSAVASAMAGDFDLLLIDAHLPDADGVDVLGALRERGCTVTALAHTASTENELHARLRAAGFADVLRKPLPARELAHAAQLHAGAPSVMPPEPAAHALETQATSLWDDAAAARALGGAHGQVGALRDLFLAELPAIRTEVSTAAANRTWQDLLDPLHRLQASCGFVGAAGLVGPLRDLREAPSNETWMRFDAAVAAYLA